VSKPIFGDLSAEMPDGTVLTAPNDLLLAWKIAEHSYGMHVWNHLTRQEQYIEVADALESLRAAYDEHETDDDRLDCDKDVENDAIDGIWDGE